MRQATTKRERKKEEDRRRGAVYRIEDMAFLKRYVEGKYMLVWYLDSDNCVQWRESENRSIFEQEKPVEIVKFQYTGVEKNRRK